MQTFYLYPNINKMKLSKFIVPVIFPMLLWSAAAPAQTTADADVIFAPKKFYLSSSLDAAILSTSMHFGLLPLNGGISTTVGTPRFTYYFISPGLNVNFDFNKNVGVFTGIGLKNLGFIEKIKPLDSTIKRRVWSIGAPVGIKVGNLRKKTYAFLGGGVDVPFNYKEKGYVRRGNKDKFNEWFSDRTASFMPYGFVGMSFKPGIYFKVQLYPGNFMNPDFTETKTVGGVSVTNKPYAVYDIEVLMFSFGMDIRYTNKMKIKKKGQAGDIM